MERTPRECAEGGRYYEYVIDGIKDMIAQGELKCGDKLPSERELAERFNVSRVPVREALKILEYTGLLSSTRGDGTYVKSTAQEDTFEKIAFAASVTTDALMDLLELRINLEAFAAYNAAQRRTDADIQALYQAIVDMRQAKKAPKMDDEATQNLRRLSHEFHRRVVQAAHNRVLTSMYENLYELLDISRQFTTANSVSYNSILAHETVFNKIVQQDAEGARRSMEEHLADVRTNLSAKLAKAKANELSQTVQAG